MLPQACFTARARHLMLGLAVLCVCALAADMADVRCAQADTTFYYFEDENGVLHFSNRKTSERFKVFAIFRSLKDVPHDEIVKLCQEYGSKHNIDPHLVQAVIEIESGYNPQAVSSAGAQGLMQIMPGTQKDLGVDAPFNPDQNVEAGVRYLRSMYDRFGTAKLALAAYNAGPAQVEKYGGVPPFKETQQYVAKVLRRYETIKAN